MAAHDGEDYLLNNSWAPPCLTKIRFCRDVCEYSTPCRTFGKCGTQWGKQRRQQLFIAATVVAFIAMILTATSLAAVTYDPAILRDVYWAKGTGKADAVVGSLNVSTASFEVFIGLNMQVVDATIDGEVLSVKYGWSDVSCTTEQCDECKSAATAMVVGMIMALVTCVPTIQTDIQRSQDKWDMNCQKFLAQFISNGVGLIGTLMSLSAFSAGCYHNMPDTISVCNDATNVCATAHEIEWGLGPGFFLIVIATLLKVFDAGVHALVATPEHCTASSAQTQKLPELQEMADLDNVKVEHQ